MHNNVEQKKFIFLFFTKIPIFLLMNEFFAGKNHFAINILLFGGSKTTSGEPKPMTMA
jgi:hypothetical protein